MKLNDNAKKTLTVAPKTVFMDNFYGLSNERNFRVFISLCDFIKKHTSINNPQPEIHIHNQELQELCRTYHVGLFNSKKFLIKKGLIICDIVREPNHGAICHITITEKGLCTYYKILDEQNKNKKEKDQPKEKHYSYTEKDLEIAKYWFKQVRKFYKKFPTRLTVDTWEETKEIRANNIRISREKLRILPEEFLHQIKTVLHSEKGDFFLKNASGANAFTKKWRNGRTVAENLCMAYEEIIMQEEIEDKLYIDEIKDLAKYENEDGVSEEDPVISKIWHAMFDILGNKLKLKYKTVKEANEATDSLQTICEEIKFHLDLAPCRLQIKFSGTLEEKNYYVYWLFVQERYKNWAGLITTEMLWDCWIEFWKRVWRLDHASFNNQDMQQFIVDKYLIVEN